MNGRRQLGETIAEWLGITWSYIKYLLAVLGGVVSANEILGLFIPNTSFADFQKNVWKCSNPIPNIHIYLIIIVLALIIRILYEKYTLDRCDIKIGKSGIKLSIRKGDLLKDEKGNVRRDGTLLIGINNKLRIDEYEQSRGTIISQLREMYPNEDWLTTLFNSQINNNERASTPQGNNSLFQMGDIIESRNISSEEKPDILFTVMSEYRAGSAPTTSIDNIEKALNNVFMHDNWGCLNNIMYCPIIGNNCGLGSSYSKEQLIILIAKCFMLNSLETACARQLIITVRPATHKDLKLRKVKRLIENMVEVKDIGALR